MDQVIALLNRRCALPRVRHDRGVVGGPTWQVPAAPRGLPWGGPWGKRWPVPPPAGLGHLDASGRGHVPDVRGLRPVRAVDDRQPRQRGAQACPQVTTGTCGVQLR